MTGPPPPATPPPATPDDARNRRVLASLIDLRKEGDAWRVDPDAMERDSFIRGCSATGAGKSVCTCMFEELRSQEMSLSDVLTDLRAGALVQQAAAKCGGP
jgi:hypothetical protein